MRRLILLVLGVVVILGISACQSDEPAREEVVIEKQSPGAPPFKLDTTLLAPPVEVEACLKTFRPPKGFEALPQIEVARLRVRYLETVQRRLVRLEEVLANDSRGAGIMVFSVGALFIHSDTTKLFEGYRNGLVESYRAENVSEQSFWLEDSIYVKDFRLTDSATVRHNVFGISRHGKAMEIQYIMPHRSAGSLFPAVKSSIVSLSKSKDYPRFDSLDAVVDSL